MADAPVETAKAPHPLTTPSANTTEHIYHAAVGEKEFELRFQLPVVPKGSALTPEWYAGMKALVDECSSTIFEACQPIQCAMCGNDAVRLLHHPMLYDTRAPPRVEDLPQPVCGRAACSGRAEQEFRTMMNMMSPTTVEGKACAFCSQPAESLLRCSRCKCAYYCNATCQKSHWPSHKVICKPV